jgi:hypothetical protein
MLYHRFSNSECRAHFLHRSRKVNFRLSPAMTERVETLRDALARQRISLGNKGILDLSGKIRFPASDLLTVGTLPTLTTLILTGCPLKSLESLPPQPCLKTLSADRSSVEILRGLNSHSSLSSVTLIEAPVADAVNFRTAALLLIPRLSNINGVVVSPSERTMRDRYPPIARQLVSAGWIGQSPPPSEQDFRYLATEFGIAASPDDFVQPPQPPASPPPSPHGGVRPTRWGHRIAAILTPLGFAIRSGKEMHSDIVKAVTQMCDVVLKVEEVEQERES